MTRGKAKTKEQKPPEPVAPEDGALPITDELDVPPREEAEAYHGRKEGRHKDKYEDVRRLLRY